MYGGTEEEASSRPAGRFFVGALPLMNNESGGTQMTQREVENVTNEILRALVSAPDERKAAALKALRGEITETPARIVNGPLLMGMGQAADFLGVSRATLWRILQAGKIKKVELFPGSYRVRKEDLVALTDGAFGFSEKVSHRGRPKKIRCQSSVVSRLRDDATPGQGGQLEDARTKDPRFEVYREKADRGDENAVGDLFREFQYDHAAGQFTDDPATRGSGAAASESDGTDETHGAGAE